MKSPNRKIERVIFGVILCIALVMFFQPIIRVHGPNGSEVGDAFQLPYKMIELQTNLRIVAAISSPAAPGTSTAAEPASTAKPLTLPLSSRTTSQLYWLIFTALAFWCFAVLDLVLLRKAFAIFSLAGGCLCAIALFYLLRTGLDLRSWTQMITHSASPLDFPNDPWLSSRIMMANSFFVGPGFGLYVLTICLLLVPTLSFTGAIPRSQSVFRRGRRASISQPVRVRPVNLRYPEETCTAVNVSHGGLLLEASSNGYYVGMEIYLTRNADTKSPPNPEEHGSVVRVEKTASGKCRLGIRIIPEA